MSTSKIPAGARIDLTDDVNANWRDNLRKNPNDPRYKGADVAGLDAVPMVPVEPPCEDC